MAFDVFQNKDVPVIHPDAIVLPSGQIVTDYPLSTDPAVDPRYQAPSTARLSELPITGIPAGPESFSFGFGFYRPGYKGLFLPSDPIAQQNADILSTRVSESVAQQIIDTQGKGRPVPPDLSALIRDYRIAPSTIQSANEQIPSKINRILEAYRNAEKPTLADTVLSIVGAVFAGIVALIPGGQPVAAAYIGAQGGIALGVKASETGKVTGKDVALTVGPSALAVAGPLVAAGPLSDAEAVAITEATGHGAISLSDPLVKEAFPAFAAATSTSALTQGIEATQRYGVPAAIEGPSVVENVLQGKIGAALAGIGRFFGLPIPPSAPQTVQAPIQQPQPQPQPGGAAITGDTMGFLPATPLESNATQWAIGAAAIVVLLFLFFRR